jgi:hypothetical protein
MAPPHISIITACYNMKGYIRDTVESIVSQGYSNLEYILMDGASTDGTLDILKEYEDQLSILVSEPDHGQYYAVQKGMDLAKGEVLAWLNADDIYYPWTLSVVSEIFQKFPEIDWIVGLPSQINAKGQCIYMANGVSAYPKDYIKNGWAGGYLGPHLQQESMFWRRSLWDRVGGLSLEWKYAADFHLWTRFAQFSEPVGVTVPLAAFRLRPGEQVSSKLEDAYNNEVRLISQNGKRPPFVWDRLAKSSQALRCLFRLMIWKKCQVISYSKDAGEWTKTTLKRPLSRSSIRRLLLETNVKRFYS